MRRISTEPDNDLGWRQSPGVGKCLSVRHVPAQEVSGCAPRRVHPFGTLMTALNTTVTVMLTVSVSLLKTGVVGKSVTVVKGNCSCQFEVASARAQRSMGTATR